MSRIYFHSPSGEAEVAGSERHYLGSLVNQLAVGMLDPDGYQRDERLKQMLPADHYLNDPQAVGRNWAAAYKTAFRVGDGPLITWRGTELSAFSLALNTCLVYGNDAVKLAARIHGQCEIHAWVDGPNRAWLADIIQAGLDTEVFRKGLWYESGGEKKWADQGWEGVITLLRARDDEPVVMSYSVCDSFPNQSIGGWMDEVPDGVDEDDHSDAWYDLPPDERWDRSMLALRASARGLEITPDDWQTFRFTHELSALDLFAADWQERLDAAVARPTGNGA